MQCKTSENSSRNRTHSFCMIFAQYNRNNRCVLIRKEPTSRKKTTQSNRELAVCIKMWCEFFCFFALVLFAFQLFTPLRAKCECGMNALCMYFVECSGCMALIFTFFNNLNRFTNQFSFKMYLMCCSWWFNDCLAIRSIYKWPSSCISHISCIYQSV